MAVAAVDDDDDLYNATNPNHIEISPQGDLVLSLFDHGKRQTYKYRVEADRLRQSSPYFARLLHPDKFAEGLRVSKEIAALRSKYTQIRNVPIVELPVVVLSDLGRISKVNSVKMLAADFLRVLHGQELSTPNPPVPNLANLAIVADRFDAVEPLSRYVRKRKMLQTLDAKTNRGAGANLTEERIRQKLLIGLLLDHGTWVSLYTKRLIIKNSSRWKPDASEDFEGALYWDLPRGIEGEQALFMLQRRMADVYSDEMIQRREFVLDTIQSLQSHFLKLYTHGERQCRLGYDTSPQCDSFQLGEMIRFFTRVDTMPLYGSIYNPEGPSQYQGDIDRLIDSLKQCPEYQVDSNHRHCGLRERILPLLNLIQLHLSMDTADIDIGICADCWQAHRSEYAWSEVKRPVSWSRGMLSNRSRTTSAVNHEASLCLKRHLAIRDMFTAVTRDWTSRDG